MISLSQSQTQTVQSKDILGDTLNHFLISYRLISFDRFRNNVKHIKIPYDDGCFYLTRAIAFGSVKVSSIFRAVFLEATFLVKYGQRAMKFSRFHFFTHLNFLFIIPLPSEYLNQLW